MNMYDSNRRPALALRTIVITTTLLFATIAHAQDWDGDGVLDADDWGVVLTFDMHPGWEQPALWQYPGNWATGQPSILDLLAAWNAPATFFVSGFQHAASGSWNALLDDARNKSWLSVPHELAWHGREHVDHPKWVAEGGREDPSNPWNSPWWFVHHEVNCDVANYQAAKGSHANWSESPRSYAYPGCTNGNPGDDHVDALLQANMVHVRAANGPEGPYDTETIANQFRLKGYWLDNVNICTGRFGCSEYEALTKISAAYSNKEIVVFAAHHLTNSTDPSLYATQMWKLIAVLDHVKCLQEGGTLEPDLLCTPSANPNPSGNPKVFHRFIDLPTITSPTNVPEHQYCTSAGVSSCGG